MQQLKVGSTLQGDKYRIEKVLGQGGFGITYLAYQELLDRRVCIKEFFFKEYCERDEATSQVSLGTTANKEMVERFMAKFVKEARTISQMEHPNIIRIFDVFKENNTAYYVMEYIEGESLADMVNRRGSIPEEEALCYIRCVADALDYVHQKHINHLDVKPGNILVRNSDKRVLLIDFGLSKQYDASGNQTSTTPVGISHGYAPIEQYKQNGVQEFSPQTDIYALGATLYKLLSGNTPPQPSDILNDGLPELSNTISENVRSLIKQAMQLRKVDRPKDIQAFFAILAVEKENVAEEPMKSLEDVLKKEDCEDTKVFVDTPTINVRNFENEALLYYKNGNYDVAFSLLEKAAKGDNVDVWVCLADCYYNGYGTDVDFVKAVEWYQKAANKDDAKAQKCLGVCYYHGQGIRKNISEAVNLFYKSAEQGNAYGQYNLGVCYYTGQGVIWNLFLAEMWVRKSAEQGHAGAQYLLAYMLYFGIGIEMDVEEAFIWFLKSADQGNANSQFCIGVYYESCNSVNRDLKKAFEWYQKSAKQGYVHAQFNLARCYCYGLGVDKDLQKAKEWMEKAACQGDNDAIKFLQYETQGVLAEIKSRNINKKM